MRWAPPIKVFRSACPPTATPWSSGGYGDNGGAGATWVFARNNGSLDQLGNKLVGTGSSVRQQGWSVSLSGDGNTALVGASGAGGNGASWVFARTNRTSTHDFNDDGRSDIAWRDGSGDIAFWLMNGATPSSIGVVSGVPGAWSMVGQRDFNGDGTADLLWHDTSGDVAMWFMNGPGRLGRERRQPSRPHGRSSASATSTATASATSCGATAAAISRCG